MRECFRRKFQFPTIQPLQLSNLTATMPKATTAADARQTRRHNPLADEYAPSNPLKQKAPKKRARKNSAEEGFVDAKASRKILRIGQDLADEEEAELKAQKPQAPNPAFAFDTRLDAGAESEEDEVQYGDDDEAWGDEEEEIVIDEVCS